MCDIIKEQYKDKQIYVYPDATGSHRETSSIQSDLAILEQNGFRVYTKISKEGKRSNTSIRDRLNATNTMLGKGNITIDTDKLPELTEDFEKCERNKYGEVDKKDEERTHASDAGSYPIVYLYPIVPIDEMFEMELK
jgi:hypothetical protein